VLSQEDPQISRKLGRLHPENLSPLGMRRALLGAGRALGPCGFAACCNPPVVPSGPLGVSPDPPAVPSGPRGVSVPSGPFGVPPHPYPPVCPPVPLVSRGFYSSIAMSNSLVRPAAAAPSLCVLLPAVRWLSSLAVAHACIHTSVPLFQGGRPGVAGSQEGN
jgi:hypothetical protein